jgi:hypothetical protein
LVLPTLFFSFSGSKLPGYILPVLPACALFAGERVTRFVTRGEIGNGAMKAIGLLAIIFSAGAIVYARRSGVASLSCAGVALFPVVAAGIFAIVWTRLRAACVLAIGSTTVLSLMIVVNCGATKLAQRESVKELLEAAAARGYSNLPICGLHMVERSVEFYGSGRVIYDENGQPAKFEGPPAVLKAAEPTGAVLVLVPLEHLHQLMELKTADVDVIADNGVCAIVAVRLRRSGGG